MIMPNTLSLIRVIFTDASQRATALSIWAAVSGLVSGAHGARAAIRSILVAFSAVSRSEGSTRSSPASTGASGPALAASAGSSSCSWRRILM